MFSPERSFPIEKIKANPSTAMVVTKYGGHIAFCEGLLPIGCNYVCRVLTEYFNIVLNEALEKPKTSHGETIKKETIPEFIN
jgi:predicted alpha/beta-fold hydrolase